jgi:hypothetical protein
MFLIKMPIGALLLIALCAPSGCGCGTLRRDQILDSGNIKVILEYGDIPLHTRIYPATQFDVVMSEELFPILVFPALLDFPVSLVTDTVCLPFDLMRRPNYCKHPGIFAAVRYEDLGKIESLLKEDPRLICSKDERGNMPLQLAAERDSTKVVELLLTHKADVNASDDEGLPPLFEAVLSDDVEMAQLLLANGADVNSRQNGRTPLDYATLYGEKKMAELLRQHGGKE